MITIDLVDERVEQHAKPATWNHPGVAGGSSTHFDPMMTLVKSHQHELLKTAQNIRLAAAGKGDSGLVIQAPGIFERGVKHMRTLAERYSNRNRIRP